MSAVVWSTTARADLDDIWLFIAQDSIEAANRLVDRLVETARPLDNFPLMGVARDELAPDLRALRSGNYILFYRPRGSTARIERVMHTRRDITAEDF